MYNVFVIDDSKREEVGLEKIISKLESFSKKFVLCSYKDGKLFLTKQGKVFYDLEIEFRNAGYYIAIEIVNTKKKIRVIENEYKISSIVGLDSRLDNYLSGVARMFSLPYFGNDLYLSTLINQQHVQRIIMETYGVKVLPYTWFYFHNLASMKQDIEEFINLHKKKDIICVSDNSFDVVDDTVIHDFNTLKEHCEYVSKSNNITKFYVKALPKEYKTIHVIDDDIFGDVDEEITQMIKSEQHRIFRALGQETTLFGIEFYYYNNSIVFNKVFSVIDYIFDFDEKFSNGNTKTHRENNVTLYHKLALERQEKFYNVLRRQFSFKSSILDDNGGAK